MHRATPLNTSLRAYAAGGARSVVDKIDDGHLMQEMAGNFLANEARKAIEAPQNYGFTSVVMAADRATDGAITDSAEAIMSFIGGHRSHPVATVMDDRRHRLKGLEPGDVAMFRTRNDRQQFHLTKDGGFWSAPEGKKLRMQLVEKQQDQQQQQQGGGGGGSGQSQGQGQGQQQQKGQDPIHSKSKEMFVEVTGDASVVSGKEVHLRLGDKKLYVHVIDGNVYLGGKKGEGTFSLVMTEAGPALNVWAKTG